MEQARSLPSSRLNEGLREIQSLLSSKSSSTLISLHFVPQARKERERERERDSQEEVEARSRRRR